MMTYAERIAAIKAAEARVAARRMTGHAFIPAMRTNFEIDSAWQATDMRDRIAINRCRCRSPLHGIQGD